MPYVTPEILQTRRISGAFIEAGFPVPVAMEPGSAAYRAAQLSGTFVDTKFVLPQAAGIPRGGAGRGTAVRGMSGGFVESKWIVAPISTGLPPARLGALGDDEDVTHRNFSGFREMWDALMDNPVQGTIFLYGGSLLFRGLIRLVAKAGF